jgi:hypothetical protein
MTSQHTGFNSNNTPVNLLNLLNSNQNSSPIHHHHQHHDYPNGKINDENKALLKPEGQASSTPSSIIAMVSSQSVSPTPSSQNPSGTAIGKILSSSNRTYPKKSAAIPTKTHPNNAASNQDNYEPIVSLKNELTDNNNNDIESAQQQEQQSPRHDSNPNKPKAKPPSFSNSTILTLLSPSNNKPDNDDFLLSISSR